MEHIEGNFKGCKTLNLYYQRYVNLANYFLPKGYAVYSFDHRGHGRSEGLRGYVERFSDYLADLETFFNIVRSEHADTRIFLVGHSMGGLITTSYSIHHQHELAGLILSGAGLKAASGVSPILTALVPMASRLLPKRGVITLDISAACQDQAVVDAAMNDLLVYRGKVRARLGAELLKVTQTLPLQMSWISLPILIMHGTADRLADPAGSQMLYEQVSSNDKTLKIYEGFYHEIFNEPAHEQVFADMDAWLAARI